MSTLETQYKKYLSENPESNFTFEDWRREILEPMATRIMEHTESLIELQKLTQQFLDKGESEK